MLEKCETSHIPIHIVVVDDVVCERKSKPNRHKTPKGKRTWREKRVLYTHTARKQQQQQHYSQQQQQQNLFHFIWARLLFLSRSRSCSRSLAQYMDIECVCYLLSFVYELEIRQILNVAKQRANEQASKKLVDCAHQSDISMIFFLLFCFFLLLRSLYSLCTILCRLSIYKSNSPIYPL